MKTRAAKRGHRRSNSLLKFLSVGTKVVAIDENESEEKKRKRLEKEKKKREREKIIKQLKREEREERKKERDKRATKSKKPAKAPQGTYHRKYDFVLRERPISLSK